MIRKKGNRGRRPQQQEDTTRINELIRVPEVRLIDAEGGQVGVVTVVKAIALAKDVGLDVVEVSPNAKPPVCRIMDYGKYKFEQAKKAKQAKAKQHVIKIKEIKLHPKTDSNDYNYRVKHAKEFLEKGFKVKVTLIYRGREMTHLEFGRRLLDSMVEDLAEDGDLETRSKMEGNSIHLIFGPKKTATKGSTHGGGSQAKDKKSSASVPAAVVASNKQTPASNPETGDK